MKRARTQAGYTLLELMIVVSIMGIIAMMAAPGLGQWRADIRHQDAAQEVLERAQRAQALATRSGYAHQLRLTPGPNGRGLLEIVPGMNHSCLKTPWASAPGAGDATLAPSAFNLESVNPAGTARTLVATIEIDGVAGAGAGVVCFEPSGRTYTTLAGVLAPQTQLAIITLSGFDSGGSPSGMERNVIFEPGGRARIQR